MFLVLLNYLKPIEDVERVTPAHRVYLDTLLANGTLILAGPKVPRNGGLFLIKASSETEVTELIALDPFKTEGIAEYSIIEFKPSKINPALNGII